MLHSTYEANLGGNEYNLKELINSVHIYSPIFPPKNLFSREIVPVSLITVFKCGYVCCVLAAFWITISIFFSFTLTMLLKQYLVFFLDPTPQFLKSLWLAPLEISTLILLNKIFPCFNIWQNDCPRLIFLLVFFHLLKQLLRNSAEV